MDITSIKINGLSIEEFLSIPITREVLMSNGKTVTIVGYGMPDESVTHADTIKSAIKSFLNEDMVHTGKREDKVTHRYVRKIFTRYWRATVSQEIQAVITQKDLESTLKCYLLYNGTYASCSNHLYWTGIQVKSRLERAAMLELARKYVQQNGVAFHSYRRKKTA